MPPSMLAGLLDNAGVNFFSKHGFPSLAASGRQFEDAAVWHCEDGNALVATTDFFTPIVDDPYDFGRIAAANALSDVYAMGALPLFALNILAMPMNKLSDATVLDILRGGATICAEAGVPIAGGHSISLSEPVYGLAAFGRASSGNVRYNAAARPGDVLILGKPLGIGILAAAHQRGELDDEAYDEMCLWATRLNSVGADIALVSGTHAMTDVSGFGLLGHLGEMCKGAGLAARIDARQVPLMERAVGMAKRGIAPGMAQRNLEAAAVTRDADIEAHLLSLFSDPQTNGGLLIACAPEACEEVIRLFHEKGFDRAAVIGGLHEGGPGIHIASQRSCK